MGTSKVKFFTTSVGDNVAYAVHGSGPFLVVPAWWVSHLELDWNGEDYRRFFETLGEHHSVVRYDRPGVGLSTRKRTDFDLESEVLVLTEVIEHIGADSCSLLGISCGGPMATAYAEQYPHRVDRLVFIGSFINGNDIGSEDMQQALCSLVSAYWGLGAKVIIDLFDPDMITDQRNLLGKTHKNSATAEMALSLLKLTYTMDATDAAKKLSIPALILHRSKDRTITPAAGKRLAMMIPGAEFKTIDGKAHLPWLGNEADQFVREILTFTGSNNSLDKVDHNQFCKHGDIWILTYAEKTVHMKDALGLRDLAQLMIHTGQEIHVRTLAAGEATDVYLKTQESEVLDLQALKEYRQRLVELEQEKQQAAQYSDDPLYEALEREQDSIMTELSRATALSGRRRIFSSDDERARKTISARIRGSIARIESLHPELADHLTQSIRTGMFCCYSPVEGVHWLT